MHLNKNLINIECRNSFHASERKWFSWNYCQLFILHYFLAWSNTTPEFRIYKSLVTFSVESFKALKLLASYMRMHLLQPVKTVKTPSLKLYLFSWDTSTSSQVSNCNGVALEIYLDHKFQWPQEHDIIAVWNLARSWSILT